MVNGTVLKEEKTQNEKPQGNKPSRDAEALKVVRRLRKREPVRKTQKQELQAYGHKFVGCGLQSDYDVTTKLGEGTFGFVIVCLSKYTETYLFIPEVRCIRLFKSLLERLSL